MNKICAFGLAISLSSVLFSAAASGQQAGVHGFPGWLRDRYQQSVSSLMPAPHAQVLVAVVLGVRTGISSGLHN